MPADNESLHEKLKRAEVLEEFLELMFAHEQHYDELLEQLEKWGISSSMGALSRFKASHIGPWSMERAKNEERDFLERHGADLDEATRRMIAQRVFQLAANPNTSSKDVLKMKDLLLREANMKLDIQRLENDIRQKDKALEQKDRALEQAERKVAAQEKLISEAKETLNKKGLSDEDRAVAMRRMFGV
jgi:hypothetical protein